jgi:alpha-methylacyl-CoA racemase
MLSGIRIVEIEGLGPGPFASMHLADLGADVIVIHRKNQTTGVTGDQSLLDRGKRSIALDLKDPSDINIALDIIRSADALIEGFRPGVMERLGLGPTACHECNPRLVYGRMTGWGQSGPRALQAGHDLNYIATSGALWYASLPDQPPVTPPTLVGDIGGGANYLVIGILAGILNARATGKGTVVDAAIVDGSAHMMNLLMAIRQNGEFADPRGQSLLDGPHWSRSYLCKDGKHVSVQCLEPKFYSEFLKILNLLDDIEFQQQYDKSKWRTLSARLEDLFSDHPSDHWDRLFKGSDACVAIVKSPTEAAQDNHIHAREIWQEPSGELQAAPAPRFDGIAKKANAAPTKDQHRAEILAELANR